MCDLDEETECENFDWNYTDDGIMSSCKDHCEGCSLWKIHHPGLEETEVTVTNPAFTFTYNFPNTDWFECNDEESKS